MEEILYRYNPWWEEEFRLRDIMPRPSVFGPLKRSFLSRDIVFLTGLRRVGKTTLLKLLIRDLAERENINVKHIFYVSLDDYLLAKRSLIEIIEEYRKIHRIRFREKVFLFLDEIAYLDNFELQLKNLYDSHNVKIYASSSSASILRSKKPYLTGRHTIVEVLPLNFEEFLQFRNIKIGKSDEHLIDSYLDEYLRTGGLPEYVLRGDIEYLKELVDDIIFKDIAAFYKIKNLQILKDLFLLLMERAGKTLSINKIARILAISPDSAKRYLQMFVNTYLVHIIPRCGKTNERILSPKKIYSADLGIRTLFTGFRDKGSLFENYVYLRIKDRNPCYIYEGGIEIDFLTSEKTLIEVKYMSDLTKKQQMLFDKLKANRKVVIKDIKSLNKYLE